MDRELSGVTAVAGALVGFVLGALTVVPQPLAVLLGALAGYGLGSHLAARAPGSAGGGSCPSGNRPSEPTTTPRP